MAPGVRIRIVNRIDGESSERSFPRFPVRIGRNPLNDLQVEQPFVSQFHVSLDFHDGQVVLQDLGSTNGTQIAGLGRASPNQPVNLGPSGNVFTIHVLDFHVSLTSDSQDVAEAARRKPLQVSRFLMAVPEELAALNLPVPNPVNIEAQRAQYAAYRSAWSEFSRELFRSIANSPPHERTQRLTQVRNQFPGIENEPDFARLLADAGLPVSAGPTFPALSQGTRQLETVAVEGLRELAQGFCPQAGPLETADQVALFLEKIQAVLEMFLKCFLPLREGHRQFESDMALRRPSYPSPATLASVEAARTPPELALALLDWRSKSNEGLSAVETAFADMMVHQVALINGVMHGVKSLLMELSPDATRDSAENAGNLGIGPYRYKAYWTAYELRYGDLANEEKQIFSRLFGKQFAQAYGRFFQKNETGGETGRP